MKPLTSDDKRQLTLLYSILNEYGYDSILDFQRRHDLVDDNKFGIKSFTELYNTIFDVTDKSAAFANYHFNSVVDKYQIVLHHTAGRDNPADIMKWWINDNVEHVGTSVITANSGLIYKCFDESHWAHHLGLKSAWLKKNNATKSNTWLNSHSVALECANWGQLTKVGDKFMTYVNTEVPAHKVIQVSYKGFDYYERYTDAEVETTALWSAMMSIRFDIPIDYKEEQLWSLSQDAFNGKPGLYTHNSYRRDKVDMSPQPHLIKALKDMSARQYYKD